MENRFAALPALLLPWFDANARRLPWRENREPYRVWVSEIMLQQTRVEAVIGYYTRFLQVFPTVADLADADEDTVFKLWEGLGYYSRARNLRKAAQRIADEYGGEFPRTYDAIRALSGVGDYTAGAIASICFELPYAAVDGNVLRVAARYGNDDTPIDLPACKARVRQELEAVYPAGNCGKFTQALMELGATVCTPRAPKCTACPLREGCAGRQAGTVQTLPVKLPKKDKRLERKTVFLLRCGDTLALTRRGADGLLAGMWELPNTEGKLDAAEALRQAEQFGVAPKLLERQVYRTHVFTHIIWDMVGYSIRCAVPDARFVWKTPEQISADAAIPTAFRKFLEEEQ